MDDLSENLKQRDSKHKKDMKIIIRNHSEVKNTISKISNTLRMEDGREVGGSWAHLLVPKAWIFGLSSDK